MQRRIFLQSLLGLMITLPLQAFANLIGMAWNKNAFVATKILDAIQRLNIINEVVSTDINLVAPDRAENGAIVQVEVTSHIANTEIITLLVEHNPTPLIAEFMFSNGALPFIVTRIKMAETSTVKVVVKANGRYFTTSKNVEVLSNGCG